MSDETIHNNDTPSIILLTEEPGSTIPDHERERVELAIVEASETDAIAVSVQVEADEDVSTEPECDEPECDEPECDEPECDEPECDEPECDEPECDEPECDDPECDEPECDDPECDEPECDEPECDEPECDDPECDEPECDEPECDDPECDEPECDEPECDEPVSISSHHHPSHFLEDARQQLRHELESCRVMIEQLYDSRRADKRTEMHERKRQMESRIEEGVAEFDQYYNTEVSALRESARTKKAMLVSFAATEQQKLLRLQESMMQSTVRVMMQRVNEMREEFDADAWV